MKITIKNLQKKIPINPSTSTGIKKALLKACSLESIKKSGEITVCFVDNKKIKELNLRYLRQNLPTDVMVFDLTEKKKNIKDYIWADIIISTDTAISNARIFKTSYLYELYLYAVHGMLHLLGYDDRNARQRKIMQEKADTILNAIHIKSKKVKVKS